MYWCTDIIFFQNPPYMASRQLLILRIAVVGTSFSPLPCQAWHGYGVTSAHRVEVEVGADGHANALPSGAAAAAPPAGADFGSLFQFTLVQIQGAIRLLYDGSVLVAWPITVERASHVRKCPRCNEAPSESRGSGSSSTVSGTSMSGERSITAMLL
jgi:hypothetical protein